MSTSNLGRRAFLAAAGGSLAAQPDGTLPPGPSGPVRIQPDRPTLLMGDGVVLTATLRPGLVSHGCKRLQSRNWSAAGDLFTWQVDVPLSGEYDVTTLTKIKGAVLQLQCDNSRTDVLGLTIAAQSERTSIIQRIHSTPFSGVSICTSKSELS